jgi:TolA-binding protein
MNPKAKLGAYVVLLILAVWFGLAFRSNYSKMTKAEAAAVAADTTAADTTTSTTTNPAVPAPATTNIAAQITNAPTGTNTAAATTNGAPATAATDTNTPAAPVPAPAPAPTATATPQPGQLASARGSMVGYLAGFVIVVIGLGVLIAIDVTHLLGEQAGSYLFFDVGDAMRDPDYEKAEAEWANGKFLDAVQLLRDYLKRNPREVHASLRIAEIYEKDLKNYLASALEYEEVLKQKLPAERWGWAAIHLCNLYSKLNKPDQTRALLHRIVDEYPKTGAARKARGRLGIVEPEEVETLTEPVVETPEEGAYEVAMEPEVAEPEPPPEPEPPKSNLPPGFRPKK